MIEAITEQPSDTKLSKNNSKHSKKKGKRSGSKKDKGAKENLDPEIGMQTGEKSKSSETDTEILKEFRMKYEEVKKNSEGRSLSTTEVQIVSEDGAPNNNFEEKQNININVDDYVDTGAKPKRSSEK